MGRKLDIKVQKELGKYISLSMESDGLEKGQLFPNMSPLWQRRVRLDSQGKGSQGNCPWVMDLNASVNDLASYCPLANIQLTVMSPAGKG